MQYDIFVYNELETLNRTQDDQLPDLNFQIRDLKTAEEIDLTGYNVDLTMRKIGATGIAKINRKDCIPIDILVGKFKYEFMPEDVNDYGTFEIEISLKDNNDKRKTIAKRLVMNIRKNLTIG
ncbi:MAG: BppU family phage baseplate upper protein [Endomicrobiia bacterium]